MSLTRANALQLLGLDKDAGPECIRARYKELVKLAPPDRAPDRFAQIHTAYKQLTDPRVMAEAIVSKPEAYHDFEQLRQDLLREKRVPVGAKAWMEFLRP